MIRSTYLKLLQPCVITARLSKSYVSDAYRVAPRHESMPEGYFSRKTPYGMRNRAQHSFADCLALHGCVECNRPLHCYICTTGKLIVGEHGVAWRRHGVTRARYFDAQGSSCARPDIVCAATADTNTILVRCCMKSPVRGFDVDHYVGVTGVFRIDENQFINTLQREI